MKKNIYGYARVSTAKQTLSRQVDSIKREFPEAVIFEEAYTGTTMARPVWDKLIRRVKCEVSKGYDVTVVFDEVSRMSRTAAEGFETYQELYSLGVELVFLKERHIDTAVFKEALEAKIKPTGTDIDCILNGVNEYLMILAKRQIEIAFDAAEKEVSMLHHRVSEGVKRAQAEGKQVGRVKGSKLITKKERETIELIRRYSKDFDGTLKDGEVIKLVGVSRNTFYKYKARMKTV
ncbi:MAG: recombinase family protein [Clostridia bacterium]|nr:recombinase family protein [Clostridia bacterium]